jgi:hypothetical protein
MAIDTYEKGIGLSFAQSVMVLWRPRLTYVHIVISISSMYTFSLV